MLRTSVIILGLMILVVARIPQAQTELRPGESVRETDALFPGAEPLGEDGEPEVWAVRIMNAWTGLPIPDAVVQVPYHVSGGATPEDIYYQHVARVDGDGWARLPYEKLEGWRDYILADAPGYAADEHCCPDNTQCALVPGTDVPVMLVDYTGRPVAGASIALNLGCGHIPDQRQAVTGADGRAVLHSICPPRHDDIWVKAPGLHRGTGQLSGTWRPGSPPVMIHAPPGIVVAGRLLTARGEPWAGAALGPHDYHRPWVHSDHEGRFRLVGISPWSVIDVYAAGDEGKHCTSFVTPPEGMERVLVRNAPTSGVPLHLCIRGPDGKAATGVHIAAVRLSDGLTAVAKSDAVGAATFSLPPGLYEVRADGELGRWGTARSRVELRDGAEPATTTIEVPLNPTVKVDASRVQGLTVGITTTRQFLQLDPVRINGDRVPVPVSERAVFRISGREDGELLVHFIEVPSGGSGHDQPIVLEWLPVTQVVARLHAPDGTPVRGRLHIVRERGTSAHRNSATHVRSGATAMARTRLTGRVDWIAVADDEALAPSCGSILLPKPGGRVDLGNVQLAPAEKFTLQVQVPSAFRGKDIYVSIQLRRANFESMSTNRIGDDGFLRAALREFSWIGTGEQLVLSTDGNPGWLPYVVRIDGPPPWRARWPTAELGLRVLDAADRPLTESVVIVDGTLFSLEPDASGRLRLHGLTAGLHNIVVAERRHRARVFRLVFRDGESRDLEVHLRARR